ncbi:MAG: hypothetical protein ACE5JS_07825 [Nitrospinota bacterium]
MKVAVAFFLSLLMISSASQAVSDSPAAYVPPILEKRSLSIEAGRVYRFPWLSEPETCAAKLPGCFHVLSLGDAMARIRFAGFIVNRGRVQRKGFIREVFLTSGATPDELFSIRDRPGPRENWVHGYYQSSEQQLVFFSRPAFVTRRAKIHRQIVMDLRTKTMVETTSVEAQAPLTLIASGSLEAAMPGAERTEITVNGQRAVFPFPNLLALNLPAGRSQVRTAFRWRRLPEEVCPWSLYEGKKMSLPTGTNLRLVGVKKRRRYEVRLRMFGISDSIWRDFHPILEVTPAPVRRVRGDLSEVLLFTNAEEIAIALKPIYFHRTGRGGATFPVLICVRGLR